MLFVTTFDHIEVCDKVGVSTGPRSMTKHMVSRLLYAIDHGMPITKATDYAGIHYSTWRAWVVEAEESFQRGAENEYTRLIAQVKEHQADFAMRQMDKIDGSPSWTAAAWMLERVFPKDFGNKQAVELSGPDGGPVVTTNAEALKDMTTEELLALDSALGKLSSG